MKEKTASCQEQLQALQQEFDEFAYIVSHDLKAPLRAIYNLSGWIQEDLGEGLEPDVAHNITLLRNRAERLERMISALLLYSRIPRHELGLQEVNTTEMVQRLGAAWQETKPFTLHTAALPTLYTYGK